MSFVNSLSIELVNLIKSYIPLYKFVFTNKENYTLYHSLIYPLISNNENYIRDIIKRDNEFVFTIILKENYKKWCKTKQYIYKGETYNTYIGFLMYYCFENDSNNCIYVIDNMD